MQRWLERLLLAAACALPFVRLGIGEIQPWDESLYVIRAQACLTFGAWLDQTQYAVGGLYSAWHPPLGIWFIAISKYLFGDSNFALRFPSALAASASVLLMALLVRHLASSSAAIIAAISMATSDLFLLYSHRAQLECLELIFILASILLFVRALERSSWRESILSGICLGFALQVKIGYGLYALPILFLLPWAFGKLKAIRFTAIVIGVALLIAVPWFIMMSVQHPEFWSFVVHSLSTFQKGKYSPASHQWWYYGNRLVVALPLLLTILFVREWSRFLFAGMGWLLAVLIVLEFFGTTMAHFAFLLLAPGAFLIGLSWDQLRALPAKSRTIFAVALLGAILWSMSEQLRLFVTHRVLWNEIFFLPVGIVCAALAFFVAIVIWSKLKSPARFALAFSVLLLGLALGHLLSEENSVYENGAEQVAIIATKTLKPNMVVIHQDFPHEQYAPQLAYYAGGWTLGWIPGQTSQTMTWDSATGNAYRPDTSRDVAVVIDFRDRFNMLPPAAQSSLDSIHRKLANAFQHYQTFRSYTVYY